MMAALGAAFLSGCGGGGGPSGPSGTGADISNHLAAATEMAGSLPKKGSVTQSSRGVGGITSDTVTASYTYDANNEETRIQVNFNVENDDGSSFPNSRRPRR